MTVLPSIDDLASNLVQSDQKDVELPVVSPLSHSNFHLRVDKEFDIDTFLLSRSTHTRLPELRSELREYLSDLKAELIQLLNDDYESFISLSTDLRSEGPRLERMKSPLKTVKEQIQVSMQLQLFFLFPYF